MKNFILNSDTLNKLKSGILELGLDISSNQFAQLVQYAQLLMKWNKFYNLTAITQADSIVKYHLLDGLTIIKHLESFVSVLDVGSGMGIPGILIAILYTKCTVVLVDCKHKKTAFLQQVKIELGLNNLHVITSRIENYNADIKFQAVISRAFSNFNSLVRLTRHLLIDGAMVLAMKGKNATTELYGNYIEDVVIIPLTIPGAIDTRYLVKLQLNNN